MQKDGSFGKVLEIVDKINALYKTYLKSDDCAMDAKEDRSRAQNLLDPCLLCEKLHDQVCDGLDEFIHGGTKLVTSHTLFLRRDKTSSRCNRRWFYGGTKQSLLNNNISRLRRTQWHFHFFNETTDLLLWASTWCLTAMFCLVSGCLLVKSHGWLELW